MPAKYQLKNGLNVLLIESKKSPVVSVQMWVKTGSADENKGLEGISHFIEHLVFKGSEQFGVGEMAAAIEGSGGVLNAYTTFDQTVFYVTLSKEHVDTGFRVISDMMARPQFAQEEIDNERGVVIEEIKRSLDNPRAMAARQLFATLYTKHPYGIPVIGYEKNISEVSREKIIKYFESRYTPQNMNLVVVGDFSSPEMKKKVAQYFGGIKKQKLQTVKRKLEPKAKSARIRFAYGEFQESHLYLAWPGPKTTAKDVVPLMLLSAILGEGESTRLVHKIKNEMGLVNSIGCHLFTARDSGFFGIAMSLEAGHISAALSEIKNELGRLFSEGIEEDELARAKRLIESDKLYSMETVDGLAALYGQYEFFRGDFRAAEKLLKDLRSTTAKEVLAVAKKYLTPQALRVSGLLSKDSKAEAAGKILISEYKKLFLQMKTSSKSSRAKPTKGIVWKAPRISMAKDAEKFQLDSGARLICKKIIGSPVLSLRLAGVGGLRYEDPRLSGLNELASRTWATRTKSKDEKRYHASLEDITSSVGAFGGRNTLGLSMTTIVPFANQAAEMFYETLNEAEFSEAVIGREKKLMANLLSSRKDKPAQKCMFNLNQQLFADHPYGRDPLGSEETINNIKAEDISRYIDSTLTRQNMVFSLVGDFSVDKWLNAIDAASKPRQAKSAADKQYEILPLKEKLLHFEEMDKQQTHIALAYRGLKFQDHRRHELDVLQAILSGQGGRLFVELRDKESLAYTVSPIRMDGIEEGYFGTYIGCSPEKAQKAYRMMQKELIRMGEELVGAEELDRAKRYLIGRHDISCQRTGAIADAMLFDELYGLPFNDFEQHNQNIRQVTAQSIQMLARDLFSKNYIVSVVGKEAVSI